MIGLINYGSGNIYAISNIYKSLNIPYIISDDTDELAKASKLVLPGVGAFDETMSLLGSKGLTDWLNEQVLEKSTPIIGVCVGMQIMTNGSEEGTLPGFGWVDAEVKKFDPSTLDKKPHLPHLGWNVAVPKDEGHHLFADVDVERGFYYLHSYYCKCNDESDILSTTEYGISYTSAFQHGNVYGVQFHPEKSHHNGTAILKNFANS